MDTNTNTADPDPTIASGTSNTSTGPTSAVPSNLPFARSPRGTSASQGGTTTTDSSATCIPGSRPRGPIFVYADNPNRPDGSSGSGQPTVLRAQVVRVGALPEEEETGEGLCCCGKVLATICGCDWSVWKSKKRSSRGESWWNEDADGPQWAGRGEAFASQRDQR
ncbi:hypothetical protein IAT38_002605 [Cryptococcus sp. DSM 104549]